MSNQIPIRIEWGFAWIKGWFISLTVLTVNLFITGTTNLATHLLLLINATKRA